MSKKGDWDDASNEVPSNWVKFNVPMEDKIMGTLIAKRTVKSTIPGREDEDTTVYELKADVGSFHELDESKKLIETPITVNEGEIWSIGGKNAIDVQMRNIKIGQKVGFKFIDEKPSKTKGFAPAKNIKVYAPKNDDGTPKMDEEWLESLNSPDNDFDNLGK